MGLYISGTHIQPKFPPIVVMERAKRELRKSKQQNWKYDVIFNNCESFTTFCLTGKRESAQSRNITKLKKFKIGSVKTLFSWSKKKIWQNAATTLPALAQKQISCV